MLQISEFEQVAQIRRSRQIETTLPYRVTAYLVEGQLIQTGEHCFPVPANLIPPSCRLTSDLL